MNRWDQFRSWTRWIGIAAAILGCIVVAYMLFGSDSADTLTADVNEQTWIDLDGVAFQHTLKPFDDSPVVGPTGKRAFRAEMCYWTREGGTKLTPTAVLLNSHRGQPEPTFCLDCDRLVTPLNPPPIPDAELNTQRRAPPSRTELESRSKGPK